MKFREGLHTDIEELYVLGQASYQEYASTLTASNWDKMNAFLTDKEKLSELFDQCNVFIAEEGNSLVGMIFLAPSGEENDYFDKSWSYIRYLGVHPNYRGQGIGKHLTRLCIKHAIDNKERFIALHTSEFMHAARNIYENMGFSQQRDFELFGKTYWVYLKELTEQVSIRELNSDDIPLVVDYFLEADIEHLINMGVDIDKLPDRETWIKQIQNELNKPNEEKKLYYLIWMIDNIPIGHSNINKIEYKDHAYMHLHIWDTDRRHGGLAKKFVPLSLSRYFNLFQLEHLYCEPYALNPSPNRVLQALGFVYVKQYECIPGPINVLQFVNRYELTKQAYHSM